LELRPNRQWWTRLGEEIAERIRIRTKSGKGVKGSFKGYSDSYKKRKSANKFKRQSSQSTTPDLTLTGDMMRDLQTRGASKSGVTIGWTGSFAERVRQNEDMGRTITSDSQALATPIQNWVKKEFDREVGRKIKKQSGQKTVIKVGV